MSLYMYQFSYTANAWAAQMRNPQDRINSVARPACEAVGAKLVGGWVSFGDYDIVLIVDAPDSESMAGLAIAVAAGGALKSSKTTPLMTGAQGIVALQKAEAVVKAGYKPVS